eukprot:1131302-Lingulodinium_polyedra.AAC.1
MWRTLHGTDLPIGAAWQMLLQGATIGDLVSSMKSAGVIEVGALPRGIQDGWWGQTVRRRLTRR